MILFKTNSDVSYLDCVLFSFQLHLLVESFKVCNDVTELTPPCTRDAIGLYRENAIAIDSEARDPFGGNVYYVTMQLTLPIPEFARKERNLHCDVVHVTTKWVSRLVLDHAIAAIQTSR